MARMTIERINQRNAIRVATAAIRHLAEGSWIARGSSGPRNHGHRMVRPVLNFGGSDATPRALVHMRHELSRRNIAIAQNDPKAEQYLQNAKLEALKLAEDKPDNLEICVAWLAAMGEAAGALGLSKEPHGDKREQLLQRLAEVEGVADRLWANSLPALATWADGDEARLAAIGVRVAKLRPEIKMCIAAGSVPKVGNPDGGVHAIERKRAADRERVMQRRRAAGQAPRVEGGGWSPCGDSRRP